MKLLFIYFLIVVLSISLYSQSLEKGIEHLNKQEYQSAIQVFESIIDKNPEYLTAYNYLGYAYLLAGRPSDAIEIYKKSDSESPTIHSKMGLQWGYLMMGEYDQSIGYGKEALHFEPENYLVLDRMGEAYLGQKKYDSAKEVYTRLIKKYNKNADLLWKLGIAEYYLGNQEKANDLFREGKEMNPEHKGILYSLGSMIDYPIWEFTPEFSSYSFSGSDYIGSGSKRGLQINYHLDKDWSFRVGYSLDNATNVNRTKGVQNYILNEYNLLQYSFYQTNDQIINYLRNGYNTYYLTQITGQSDFLVYKYTAGLTHRIDEKLYFTFSPQYIKSNSSLLDGAGSGQLGYYWKESGYTIGGSVSGISFPYHKGAQASVFWFIPFWKDLFYSNTNLTGQIMNVTSYETVLVFPNPVTTYQSKNVEGKRYGFLQQEFGFHNGNISFLIGGRIGSSKTPLMNEYWITTPFTLMAGAFTGIGFHFTHFDFNISYAMDRWNETDGVWSYSRQGKISITGRF